MPRPRCNQAATAGFTLIEVVVALAVVATVLTAIGSLAAVNFRGVRSVEQSLTDVEVARVIMGNLPARATLAPGNYTGQIAGHRWRIDVTPYVSEVVRTRSPTTGQPLPWVPMLVVVTVRNPGGHTVRLDTIRLAQWRRS